MGRNELRESCGKPAFAVCVNSRNAAAGNLLLPHMMTWWDSRVELASSMFDWVEGW